LSCALVRGRGRCIVFGDYYLSLASIAGKDFRDGAVVPFEWFWFTLACSLFAIRLLAALCAFQLVTDTFNT
jgi:hypothetical protein